ncbi:hypothetical protein llap_19451 [Limosa lapponica baueri]|uniref:Acyl-CoA dehydrogenase/oxidase N-terminal domain-containing protein n=1 Tax=Limosa lapponica baueri TaxID=1758121 RepID=A0A2I0T8X9_LIMLA|nr:hypothetical protein llap_19451 [Limosa lapponica baueri]
MDFWKMRGESKCRLDPSALNRADLLGSVPGKKKGNEVSPPGLSCVVMVNTSSAFSGKVPLRPVQLIDKEINPFVDKWEEEGQFPAHTVFKALGQAGFLGVDKPTGQSTVQNSMQNGHSEGYQLCKYRK